MKRRLGFGKMLPADISRCLLSFCPLLLRLPLHRRCRRVLELQPIRRPAGTVARPQPLRDNPLQAHLAGKETILVERMLSRASLPAGPY